MFIIYYNNSILAQINIIRTVYLGYTLLNIMLKKGNFYTPLFLFFVNPNNFIKALYILR